MPDDYYVSRYSGEEIDDLLGKAGSAVRYDAAQSLTAAQQTQARGNINAAPSGYGLGQAGKIIRAASATEDFATFTARLTEAFAGVPEGSCGFFRVQAPWAYSALMACIFYRGSASEYLSVETVGTYSMGTTGWRLICSNGTWLPVEYFNPTMQLGVEYRTTERFLGKPVYAQIVDFGALPNNTTKELASGNMVNVREVIRWSGILSNGYVLPGGNLSVSWGEIVVRINSDRIAVKTSGDNSMYTARFVLHYTKTTD